MERDNAPLRPKGLAAAPDFLPYGAQWIDEDDIAAVAAVLRSPFVTQGPEIERFESALAEVTGARHAVALSSGTAALHLACAVLGVEAGKTGITTPISFAASANCILYCGGSVAFADVDPVSGLIDPAAVEGELAQRARRGAEPGVVVAVSLAGRTADLPKLMETCERFGWKLIEDAAHSLGATYRAAGRTFSSGSCTHSHAAILSFHPVKHVCSGEGGAFMTNDAELAARVRRLRSHGIVRPGPTGERPPWHYEQIELGFNYRLSDIHAAIGRSQLRKLPAFLERRRQLARRYAQALSERSFADRLSAPRPDDAHAWHLYIVHFRDQRLRRRAHEHLMASGIGSQVHYIPIYRHPWYRALLGEFSLPKAEAFHQGCLSLPLFPRMSDADQDRVIALLAEALA